MGLLERLLERGYDRADPDGELGQPILVPAALILGQDGPQVTGRRQYDDRGVAEVDPGDEPGRPEGVGRVPQQVASCQADAAG